MESIKKPRRKGIILGIVGLAFLLVLAFAGARFIAAPDATFSLIFHFSDPRYARFNRLFWALKPGMTREEVFETVDRIYPEYGKRARPKIWADKPTYLTLFLNNEGQRGPSNEGIILTWSEPSGVVARKNYSPD